MFVCEKCHELDRQVTKCDLDAESHGLIRISGGCSVCGKSKPKLMWCYNYEKVRRNENEKAFRFRAK
jgi:hypothetical protein